MRILTAPFLILSWIITTSGMASSPFPDLAPIETESVPLRLQKGDRINISISPSHSIHKSNPLVGGVGMTSLSRWADGMTSLSEWSEGLMPFSMETGQYSLPPTLEKAFIDMRLPTTRFYAITQEEPFDNLEDSIDAVALFMGKIGIPTDKTVMELEDYSADTTFSPEEWADAVKYGLKKNYGFRMWEIGNEVYSSMWGTGKAFPTPEVYVKHFVAVSKAIKKVHPEALVGVSVPRSNKIWGDSVLKATAGHYDFVCPHFYGGFFNIDDARFEDVVISDNHDRMDKILTMNRLIKELNPDKETFIYDTEWGLHGRKQGDEPGEAPGKADFQPRNGNIMGTVYRAVRLVYYARENLIRGACGWKSLTRLENPGFATLYYTEPERRTMLYWLYYYFNTTLRENVAHISGTVPYHESFPLVPIVATTNPDGNQATVMLVNGSWDKTYPAKITLKDFEAETCKAVILSDDDLDAYPHLDKKSDFVNDFPLSICKGSITFDLPPHSIVFIDIGVGPL